MYRNTIQLMRRELNTVNEAIDSECITAAYSVKTLCDRIIEGE